MIRKHIRLMFYTVPVILCLLCPEAATAQIHTDETPLYQACRDGDIDRINRLIKSGASVNGRNTGVFSKGSTPIFGAIESGNADIVKLIIDHGAKINISGYEDQTPLHAAAYLPSPGIVELLIKHGAKVNSVSKGDRSKSGTALHVATERAVRSCDEMMRIRDIYKAGYENDKYYKKLSERFTDSIRVIQILIENGADVNIRRPGDGFTQLHILASIHTRTHRYSPEAVKEVMKLIQLNIEHGGDASLLSADKKTALYYAGINRNEVIETYLKSKSGNTRDNYYEYFKETQESLHRQDMLDNMAAGGISLLYLSASVYCYESKYKDSPGSNPMVKFNTYLTISAVAFCVTTFTVYELFMNLDKSGGFAKGAAALVIGGAAGLIIGVPAAIIITKKSHLTGDFGDNRGLYYAAPALSMAIPIFMFTYKF